MRKIQPSNKKVNIARLLVPIAGIEEVTKITDKWMESTKPFTYKRLKAGIKGSLVIGSYMLYTCGTMVLIGKGLEYLTQ